MSTFTKNTDAYVETEIDDELVLMHLDTGSFFGLKDTGLAIWSLLDTHADPAAIKTAMLDKFDVAADACNAEVDKFLGELEDAGFVAKA